MHRPTASPLVAGLGICALALSCLCAPMASAAPDPTPAASSTTTTPGLTIGSSLLEVTLSKDFPQVLGYRDLTTGAALGGQPTPRTSITINGTAHATTVQATPTDGRVDYHLTMADLPGVEVDVRMSVSERVLTWQVTKVTDSADVTVNTLLIPGLDLVSVSSSQPGATSAFTRIDTNSTRTADVIKPLTADTAPEANPTGASYAILNTAELAASVETNGTVDKPKGVTTKDGGRFWHQVQANDDGSRRVGITPGEWTVRGEGAPEQSELPWAKVVVTGDANADNSVTWQDGAIAFRQIGHLPKDADKVPDRVIQHIPFNFASLATHPFLRTLDDVKRLSLATDGLGQFALLKGYASEGHDSAHPDYAGNYNERAGGLKDMNVLLEQGKKWGADFGVHVNATEAYPEAKAFDEKLVDKNAPGWNWLNQSYYMNQRHDLNSGDLLKRTAQLRADTKGNLDTLYWDVYYSFGWIPDEMDAKLREQGWSVASEWAYSHERDSIWSHWATDRKYGGVTNKGVNSQIVRFIRNSQKDVWNPHPLLGGSTIVEAEGWTGHKDWNALMGNVWTNQLPTKFLQHQQITRWDEHTVELTAGVRVSDEAGHRQVFVDDQMVLDGTKYLLPWGGKTPQAATKLYHFNPEGGATTWQLTGAMAKSTGFVLYELSDQGRKAVTDLAPVDGKLTITAKAGTAYVLQPRHTHPVDPKWGEGTLVKDPGFNDAKLTAWDSTGKVSAYTSPTGQHEVALGAGKSSITQHLKGLVPGQRYAASAWVEIEPGKTRTVTLKITGRQLGNQNVITSSPVENVVASDELRETNHQRVKVIFTAPKTGMANLVLNADSGDARVLVDDVRVVATQEKPVSGKTIVEQDFENLDQGWLPFVAGPAQAGGDGRTHLANLHAPYTQAGWNGKLVDDVLGGKFSLKAHEEAQGLVYRTWQGTAPLVGGHRYRVEFDHQNAVSGAYSLAVGVDQQGNEGSTPVVINKHTFGEQRTTARYDQVITTPSCGSPFLGLVREAKGGSQADFILDNLRITDLGVADVPAACATAAVTGPSGLVPGEPSVFTTSFTNHELTAVSDVQLALTAPEGWTVSPMSSATHASVEPGATVRTTWRVTVPATVSSPENSLSTTASYAIDGGSRTATGSASFSVLPAGLVPQSRLMVAGVSDAEPGTGDGSAQAAIDGNPATMWHSAWSRVPAPVGYPHWIALDLGEDYDLTALDYQVRIGNGSIKGYEVYVSSDGKDWGKAVATGQFASTTAVQKVTFPSTRGRFVKLVGLSSINGAAFGGASELNVWGTRVNPPALALPKDEMKVVEADSEETTGENGAAANAIDGNPATFWHTQWYGAAPAYPHHLSVDLGASHELSQMTIQSRADGALNGQIKDYEVRVSTDGTTWSEPVATGSLISSRTPQRVIFAAPTTARFVKVTALSSINGAPFAAIAELDFFTK